MLEAHCMLLLRHVSAGKRTFSLIVHRTVAYVAGGNNILIVPDFK